MTAAPAATAGPSDAVYQLRLTSRLAVNFLLDIIDISRMGGHVLDALLLFAVIQANVDEINRRGDLQVTYARSDEVPPDELRRPVTMNALANSLELPFETVRRRMKKLIADGHCVMVEGGVVVPSAVLSQPLYEVNGFRAFERVRAFYYELSELGLLRDLPPPTVRLSPDKFPMRAVVRLAGAYVLRVVEALGKIGDLVDSLIVLEIFRCNLEHLPVLAADDPARDPSGFIPDAMRKPVAVTTIAARIGVAPETVRRHVSGLLAKGHCSRVRGGLVIPVAALRGSELAVTLEVNLANLHRLFASYSQLGVLQVWDTVRPSRV